MSSVYDAMREQIRTTPLPAQRRWRSSAARPRLVAGSVTAVACVAVAVLIAFAIPGAPPAFAVTTNADGTVTITLRQLNAVTDLDAELASLGLRIRAVPVLAGCDAPARVVYDGRPGPRQTLEASPPSGIDSNGRRFELGALMSITVTTRIAPGQTLVLAASRSGLETFGEVVQGPAPPCVGNSVQR